MISQVLGGIGLFLIGMILATDGLRAAAGDSLRRVLLRFTGGPISAMLSGAAITALVQSSSATTVATIGFVSAGLLGFQQALGVILGANLGTTATGWLVALVGLKFSVSTIALPAVGIGAIIRLFGRGKWKDIGIAIAGFGTIFVGLDVLQAGMADLKHYVTPETLPGDTWLGRLGLVGIGFTMTAVMQSSSAGVATALSAVHAGTVSMVQAAAMVVGINVGTTVTAGIAAIGGSTAARRTAVAHVIFNIITGVLAFATLPLFVQVVMTVGERFDATDATLTLAAFHTAFNLLGVVIIYPFIGPFAKFVVRIVPSREPELTRRLDRALADQGAVAIEAVRETVFDIARVVVDTLHGMVLRGNALPDDVSTLDVAAAAVVETHAFVAAIRDLDSVSSEAQTRHVGAIHALDRIDRLIELGRESLQEIGTVDDDVGALLRDVLPLVEAVTVWLEDPGADNPVERLAEASPRIAEARRDRRRRLLAATSVGEISPEQAFHAIDRIRRLDQMVYYLWRLASNLQGERNQTLPTESS